MIGRKFGMERQQVITGGRAVNQPTHETSLILRTLVQAHTIDIGRGRTASAHRACGPNIHLLAAFEDGGFGEIHAAVMVVGDDRELSELFDGASLAVLNLARGVALSYSRGACRWCRMSTGLTTQQRTFIDEWAKIIFGSQIAGRYLLDGGEMPGKGRRGYWRSESPRLDKLTPEMVVRLGELLAQDTDSTKIDSVISGPRWLFGLGRLNHHQFLVGPAYRPTMSMVRDAAASQDIDDATLMELLFDEHVDQWNLPRLAHSLDGLSTWICEHADLFRVYIAKGSAHTTDIALAQLEMVELMLFADDIVAGITSGTVHHSRRMWRHADRLGYALLAAPLEGLATTSRKADQRANALTALQQLAIDPLDRETLRAWAADACGDDEAPAVQKALSLIAPELIDYSYELPDINYDLQPDPALKITLGEGWEAASKSVHRLYTKQQFVDNTWELLLGLEPDLDKSRFQGVVSAVDRAMPFIDDLPTVLQLRVRSLRGMYGYARDFESDSELTPLALWLMQERYWPDEPVYVQSFLRRRWSAEDCYPFIAHKLDAFIDLSPDTYKKPNRFAKNSLHHSIEFAFHALPALPHKAYLKFLPLGISGSEMAWDLLAGQPELFGDLIALLASNKWADRAGAARWLGQLGDSRGNVALIDRLAKERHLEVRFALVEALDLLGEPPENYLSEDALLAEAATVLKRPAPAPLDWLDVHALPGLCWANGSQVEPQIVELLVRQAAALKHARPTAIARSVMKRMDPTAVTAWCDALFHGWITEDQSPISLDEARERAAKDAKLHMRWIESDIRPARMPDGTPHSIETLVDLYLPRHRKTPAGSAAKCRGLLSLVSVGSSADVIDSTMAYLRRFYGKRAHQARALLEMLAHLDAPEAAPALLTIAHRFRTKGLQQFAGEQAETLAERKGWTIDDLRWRSVADGGFDRDGLLALDFGAQQLSVSLASDLTVKVARVDGTELKKLPAPRADDDAELAADAKKDFNAAKKAMRSLAKELPTRLHEAMCIRRQWAADEFRTYVLDHPVLAQAATRIVWQQGDDQSNIRFFRPDFRGNILDVEGGKSGLDERAITIAHGSLMHADLRSAWTQHLKDHGVAVWFDQFSHTTHRPVEDGQTRFDHFQGAIFTNDKRFVGALSRVGWTRGSERDGAFLRDMVKRFAAAELTAHLNCGGLAVTFVSDSVVMLNLEFTAIDENRPVPLAEVPRILLMETLAEIETIVHKADRHDEGWHGLELFERRHYAHDVRPDLKVVRR